VRADLLSEDEKLEACHRLRDALDTIKAEGRRFGIPDDERAPGQPDGPFSG
jgi:hypothetical protein